MDKQTFNKKQKEARADLKAMGICVDCRCQPVKPAEPGKPPHVCCASCLDARKSRVAASTARRFFVAGPTGRLL